MLKVTPYSLMEHAEFLSVNKKVSQVIPALFVTQVMPLSSEQELELFADHKVVATTQLMAPYV